MKSMSQIKVFNRNQSAREESIDLKKETNNSPVGFNKALFVIHLNNTQSDSCVCVCVVFK